MMVVFYTDCFVLPLPPGHRFPMEKYAMLRERVAREWPAGLADIRIPAAATDAELSIAHDRGYVQCVARGELPPAQIRQLGFPWSPELVERSRRSVGATIEACRAAFSDGVSVNLAGGTHHAFADAPQGYCVFNDAVVAARLMQREGRARRVAIIDCDVHQGNGTAALAAGDASIFTFSIHGQKNFPFRKERSDLDVGLADGTGDREFLAGVARGIRAAIEIHEPDLVIYLAGADPHEGDRLGRLSVTKAGLARRDDMVLGACRDRRIPVAIAMAGGYGRDISNTVDIQFATVARAAAVSIGWTDSPEPAVAPR